MQAKQEIIKTIEILPQNALEEALNYMLYLKEKSEKKAVRPPFKFDCLKGKIKEADDHDWFEPMEDFEDYM